MKLDALKLELLVNTPFVYIYPMFMQYLPTSIIDL